MHLFLHSFIFVVTIVIRNEKIVWKVVCLSITCRSTWVPEDTSTQATSAYIKCKHWLCRKVRMVKTTVFFICDLLFGALIDLNFIILILMFLTYHAWCKLCNIWLFLCENNSRSITIPELLNTGGKYCYYLKILLLILLLFLLLLILKTG